MADDPKKVYIFSFGIYSTIQVYEIFLVFYKVSKVEIKN